MASAQSAHSEFRPTFAECERHGKWQQTVFVDGIVRFLPCCSKCMAEHQIGQILGRAGVPPRFLGKRLSDFVAESAGQKEALALAVAYAKDFDAVLKVGRSLLFYGNPGTGKTHLALGILNELLASGFTGLYSTVIEAVRRVKETWSRGSEFTEREAIRRFIAPDLLVLDEVGVQFGSDAERLILFEIVNGRYEKMLPTLLMANLDVKGVEDNLGPRAVDRLREGGGRCVVFDWQSYRGKS